MDEAIQSLGNDGAVEDFVTQDGKRPALRVRHTAHHSLSPKP